MVLNLALKTEYSFGKCYLPIADIHKYAINGIVGIADLDNTFGHIPLQKQADKHGFKPIFGVRLRVSRPENAKRQTGQDYTVFLAKNDKGLQDIYKLVKKAYDQFYFFPRLKLSDIENLENVFVLSDVYENFYPEAADRGIYQIIAGGTKRGDQYLHSFDQRVGQMHIIPQEFGNIADQCNAKIEKAGMVHWTGNVNIVEACKIGFKKRGINANDSTYVNRMEYELDLILKKDYQDYFLIVADMIAHAKKTMLVGPSRGSSAGSLVCYLLGITEVDPIKHELIFERFIDINRMDLPDIDIDFPDRSRGLVLKYLAEKYGHDNVRPLGAVNRFMPKSAIQATADALYIPRWVVEPAKDAIIERMGGDSRAKMRIEDTLKETEPGRALIEQYPKMLLASRIEGHASHSTRHAAGVIVSTKPLYHYAGINSKDDIIMMDKKDAEYINLLKIDALGLRTLSILEDAVKQIPGMKYSDVYKLPLDDKKTYDIFNNMRLNGVFQFEGMALKIVTGRTGANKFTDLVAITALSRPGALNSGGTDKYVLAHTGRAEPKYYCEEHRRITGDTYGVTTYQEQMMEIARIIGKFSWVDVSILRKAASKSMGDEFFGKYKDAFIEGAREHGLSEDDSLSLWNDISKSGSWSFNKAHAVSYALISYWTAYFKAHHPLEFAVASLNNARDDDHAIKLLRDMIVNDGIQYSPVIPEKSGIYWSVIDGKLAAGLTSIKGVGEKKAKELIAMRSGKKKITPSFWKLMSDPKTSFDIIFPTDHYWGKLYRDPVSYGLEKSPTTIEKVSGVGEWTVIGLLIDRNVRDLNEHVFLKERDGKLETENVKYLNFQVEDDTGVVMCTIDRYKYANIGLPIAERGKIGESWYLIKGRVRGTWRKITVDAIVNLNERFGDLTK